LLMRSGLSVADVREARAMIETQLAPLAASRSTRRDWELLRQCLADYANAVEADEWKGAEDAHLRFHYGLLEGIHLPALHVILKPMQQIILFSSSPPGINSVSPSDVWTSRDVKLHYPIVAALERRDEAGVLRAMERHFASSLRMQKDRLASIWNTPFRESGMAQMLLTKMLTAKSPDFDQAVAGE